MTGMDMGIQQIHAASADGLRYTVRGSYLSMQGAWEMEIVLRRPGYDDIRQTFDPIIPGRHDHTEPDAHE